MCSFYCSSARFIGQCQVSDWNKRTGSAIEAVSGEDEGRVADDESNDWSYLGVYKVK